LLRSHSRPEYGSLTFAVYLFLGSMDSGVFFASCGSLTA
jgi:choline-glycine betaine transporter